MLIRTTVGWDFEGKGGLKAAHKLLHRCGLRHLAQQEMGTKHKEDAGGGETVVWSEGFQGWVTLDASDPRLESLLKELTRQGVWHWQRSEFRYSRADLNSAPWLSFHGGRSIFSALLKSQIWDWASSCPQCGGGSRPIPPLFVKFDDLRGATIGRGGDGRFVVCRGIADAIRSAKLTGVVIRPVRQHVARGTRPNSKDYFWLDVVGCFPRLSKRVQLNTAGVCNRCRRTGFVPKNRPFQLVYPRAPKSAPDFNTTWERWGDWEVGGNSLLKRPIGGHQYVIVSQRARRVLREAGFTRIRFEPVFFERPPVPTARKKAE